MTNVASIDPVARLEQEAKEELFEELSKVKKAGIKDKLRQIEKAKAILANLQREYAELLEGIRDEVRNGDVKA